MCVCACMGMSTGRESLTQALLSTAWVQIPAPLFLTTRQVGRLASLFGAWFYHL